MAEVAFQECLSLLHIGRQDFRMHDFANTGWQHSWQKNGYNEYNGNCGSLSSGLMAVDKICGRGIWRLEWGRKCQVPCDDYPTNEYLSIHEIPPWRTLRHNWVSFYSVIDFSCVLVWTGAGKIWSLPFFFFLLRDLLFIFYWVLLFMWLSFPFL